MEKPQHVGIFMQPLFFTNIVIVWTKKILPWLCISTTSYWNYWENFNQGPFSEKYFLDQRVFLEIFVPARDIALHPPNGSQNLVLEAGIMPQVVDRDVVFLQQKPGGKNGRVSQGKFPIVEFFGWVNQVADDQCLWGEYHPRKWTNVIWKGTISEGKLVFQPAILRVVVSFCFEMRFHPSKLGEMIQCDFRISFNWVGS